eukprot:Nk52_evm1s692 gene=Nk52_evmTU1s692
MSSFADGGNRQVGKPFLLKLLLIGDSGVGKTNILTRFAENKFADNYITTIGVDFKVKTVEIDGNPVKLQIWDTAGQERFRTITTTYYRGTHGVMVVYDVTNGDSFSNVKLWLSELKKNCDSSVILVGNKDDDKSMKVVDSETALGFAQSLGIDLFETSAKQNTNISEAFKHLAQLAYLKCKDQLIKEQKERERRASEKIDIDRAAAEQQQQKTFANCC